MLERGLEERRVSHVVGHRAVRRRAERVVRPRETRAKQMGKKEKIKNETRFCVASGKKEKIVKRIIL